MEIIRDLTHFQAEKNMAVSIGNFDGVHLGGHAAIVKTIVTLAKERGFESGLVTFDPHPMKFFGAGGVKLLQTTEMKVREFERLGGWINYFCSILIKRWQVSILRSLSVSSCSKN